MKYAIINLVKYMKIEIGVSNRHIHLKKEDLNILFGDGYELKVKNELKQPGQYAAHETLIIKTEKSTIENVRVLGPVRPYTQVEISKTDAYKLGLNPPVRDSGELSGSDKITIVGPKGEVTINEGVIIATRHIHLLKEHIKAYNLENKEVVSVRLFGEKGGIIENVHLKVSDEATLELHIDTDDANAHLVKSGDIGEIL